MGKKSPSPEKKNGQPLYTQRKIFKLNFTIIINNTLLRDNAGNKGKVYKPNAPYKSCLVYIKNFFKINSINYFRILKLSDLKVLLVLVFKQWALYGKVCRWRHIKPFSTFFNFHLEK